jgi:hypothetical protein
LNSELFHKAWLESRARFLCALIALCGLVATVVLVSRGFRSGYEARFPNDPLPYTKYIWLAVFTYYLQGTWIIAAVLLGLGGVVREGASSYTLALPVKRSQLIGSRCIVGIAESLIVATAPALLIPVLSPFVGQTYSWQQAILLSLLMDVAGAVFFGFGLLLSATFKGEFTAPVIALCAVGVYFVGIRARWLHAFSVLDVMSGDDYVNGVYSLVGVPWVGVFCSLAVAALLFIASKEMIRLRDF